MSQYNTSNLNVKEWLVDIPFGLNFQRPALTNDQITFSHLTNKSYLARHNIALQTNEESAAFFFCCNQMHVQTLQRPRRLVNSTLSSNGYRRIVFSSWSSGYVFERGNLFSVSCCTSQSVSPGIKTVHQGICQWIVPSQILYQACEVLVSMVVLLPIMVAQPPADQSSSISGALQTTWAIKDDWDNSTLWQHSCCQLYSAASKPYSGPNAGINKWLYNHFILMRWLWNRICLYVATFILKL